MGYESLLMYIKSIFGSQEFESHVLLLLVVCSRPDVKVETLDSRVISDLC